MYVSSLYTGVCASSKYNVVSVISLYSVLPVSSLYSFVSVWRDPLVVYSILMFVDRRSNSTIPSIVTQRGKHAACDMKLIV